jgi:S-DNA-T family DNA segregation ATPase FtsK/SpoIIIE
MAALVSGECDLARDLGVTSVRVRESLPGYPGCIGLEVPNSERGTVLFQDTIMTMASKPKDKPYLAVGASSTGMPVALDLTAMPHLLVAGTTRSGKSQFLHGAICSLIRMDAKDLELVLVDPKMVEFTAYAHLPHLREPVATGVDSAGQVLTRLVAEMDRRYTELAAAGMSDIGQYRAAGKQMSYVVAIVDEFGDLMMSGLKHVTCMVETCVIRLAQKGRAAGVHLILSTQNPTVSVISNQIKANMPMRVAFKVTSYTESKVILDQGGAEQLLGEGDMLLSTGERLQGAYLDKQTIVGAVKAAGG